MPTQNPPSDPPNPRPLRTRDALTALFCIALGLSFGVVVWMQRGREPAQQYLAGYLIELSLSADNVFVFALVFSQFALDPLRQRGLLMWGIVGAILLRTAFILAGIGAIEHFAWVVPVFGALVMAAGIRLAFARNGHQAFDPSGRVFQFVLRHAPAGLAALIVLETADLIFALDSLPAVLSVTHDPMIAIASNFFAILGLRSLFFVVSGAMGRLRYLNAGVAAILAFVGAKMLVERWYPITTTLSLAVIASLLALSVVASLVHRRDVAQKRPGAP